MEFLCIFSPCPCRFSLSSAVSSLLLNHPGRWNGLSELLLDVNMYVCAWSTVMDWCPNQGVLQPCAQCSEDRFQIHHDPEPDRVLLEVDEMKE